MTKYIIGHRTDINGVCQHLVQGGKLGELSWEVFPSDSKDVDDYTKKIERLKQNSEVNRNSDPFSINLYDNLSNEKIKRVEFLHNCLVSQSNSILCDDFYSERDEILFEIVSKEFKSCPFLVICSDKIIQEWLHVSSSYRKELNIIFLSNGQHLEYEFLSNFISNHKYILVDIIFISVDVAEKNAEKLAVCNFRLIFLDSVNSIIDEDTDLVDRLLKIGHTLNGVKCLRTHLRRHRDIKHKETFTDLDLVRNLLQKRCKNDLSSYSKLLYINHPSIHNFHYVLHLNLNNLQRVSLFHHLIQTNEDPFCLKLFKRSLDTPNLYISENLDKAASIIENRSNTEKIKFIHQLTEKIITDSSEKFLIIAEPIFLDTIKFDSENMKKKIHLSTIENLMDFSWEEHKINLIIICSIFSASSEWMRKLDSYLKTMHKKLNIFHLVYKYTYEDLVYSQMASHMISSGEIFEFSHDDLLKMSFNLMISLQDNFDALKRVISEDLKNVTNSLAETEENNEFDGIFSTIVEILDSKNNDDNQDGCIKIIEDKGLVKKFDLSVLAHQLSTIHSEILPDSNGSKIAEVLSKNPVFNKIPQILIHDFIKSTTSENCILCGQPNTKIKRMTPLCNLLFQKLVENENILENTQWKNFISPCVKFKDYYNFVHVCKMPKIHRTCKAKALSACRNLRRGDNFQLALGSSEDEKIDYHFFSFYTAEEKQRRTLRKSKCSSSSPLSRDKLKTLEMMNASSKDSDSDEKSNCNDPSYSESLRSHKNSSNRSLSPHRFLNNKLDSEIEQLKEEFWYPDSSRIKEWNKMVESGLKEVVTWDEDGRMFVFLLDGHERQTYLNSLMRYGIPPPGIIPLKTWLGSFLAKKHPISIYSYHKLFMKHLFLDPVALDDSIHFWSDGLPKEGVSGASVLSRISMLALIRNKVIEYEDKNELSSAKINLTTQFNFDIYEGGLTQLHKIWQDDLNQIGTRDLKKLLSKNWNRHHDYWLLAGIFIHGYAAWKEIILDKRFKILYDGLVNLGFHQGENEEISNHSLAFLLHRLRILEQSLLIEFSLFNVAWAFINNEEELVTFDEFNIKDIKDNENEMVKIAQKKHEDLSLSLQSQGPVKEIPLPDNQNAKIHVIKAVERLQNLLEDLYADMEFMPAVVKCAQ